MGLSHILTLINSLKNNMHLILFVSQCGTGIRSTMPGTERKDWCPKSYRRRNRGPKHKRTGYSYIGMKTFKNRKGAMKEMTQVINAYS